MSLARAVAHNTALQLAGKVISTLLGLAAFAIMTRSLSTEQFGWFITTTGFLQFIGILTDFGFTVTTSNLLAEPGFNKKQLVDALFAWRFRIAVFFHTLAALAIFLFPYPIEIKIATVVISFSFIALALNHVFIGYYRTELKMLTVTISEILGRVALVVGIALAAYTGIGFMPMMFSISIASVLSTLYLWIKYGKINIALVWSKIETSISKRIFSKMWPTAIAIIFNTFYLQGDRLILPLFVSQSEVGLYGAAYRVLDIVLQSTAMIMGITMPLITYAWSRGLKDEFKKRVQMSFDLMALFIIPMVVGAIALATPLITFVAGGKYEASGQILVWLSVAMLGIGAGMTFGHILLSINKQRQALPVYIVTAVLSVIGYFIFIPRYGVLGAAGVTVFSELLAGILLAVLTIYYSKFVPSIIALLNITLASLIMGAVLYYIQPTPFLVSLLLGAVTYAVLIVVFRVISPATIKEIMARK